MNRLKGAGRRSWPALIAILTITLSLLLGGAALSADEAKGGDWKEISLIYTSDVVGKIDPCG